jgi:hypothetical protein
VEGLLPTFVLNLVAKSAATVAKNNGIGNTFGLDDSTPTICKLTMKSQYLIQN